MTHRQGEEELTERVEKAKRGSRFLVIVGQDDVITRKLGPRSNRQMVRRMKK